MARTYIFIQLIIRGKRLLIALIKVLYSRYNIINISYISFNIFLFLHSVITIVITLIFSFKGILLFIFFIGDIGTLCLTIKQTIIVSILPTLSITLPTIPLSIPVISRPSEQILLVILLSQRTCIASRNLQGLAKR